MKWWKMGRCIRIDVMKARCLVCLLGLFLVPALVPAQVQQEWVRRYGGTNHLARPWAIQTDSGGNAYVTGSSWTPTNYSDFVTLKYAPDGALLWTAVYNSAGGSSGDFAYALALDESGNVYVLGSSDNAAPPGRLTLVKY